MQKQTVDPRAGWHQGAGRHPPRWAACPVLLRGWDILQGHKVLDPITDHMGGGGRERTRASGSSPVIRGLWSWHRAASPHPETPMP